MIEKTDSHRREGSSAHQLANLLEILHNFFLARSLLLFLFVH
jgi:hypothetical protein